MTFINHFSVSDTVFSVVTPVTAVTPYSGAACAVTTSVFHTGYSGYKLTLRGFKNILKPLSEHLKGGIGISFILGFNKPLSNVVFYCPQKIKAVSIRLLSMVGCIGESKDSPHLVAVCQPDTVRRPMIGIISSGLNPQILGHTAMNTSSGETTPQIPKLIFELESIETLSLQSNNLSCSNPKKALADTFQHSQNALDILHDLKSFQGIKKPT